MPFLDPQTIIRTGGYVLITAIIFAECGLLIGFFLPGDSLLFTAGFLASQMVPGTSEPLLNVWLLTALCGIAAALGPAVGYWFGHVVGPRLFTREDSIWFHKRHLQRAHEFYERHGGKALILARFLPIVRTFAPIVAGIGAMNYARFVLYTLIGAVLWAIGVIWLGYLLGSSVPEFGKYMEIILPLIVAVSLAPSVIHVWRENGGEITAWMRARLRGRGSATL